MAATRKKKLAVWKFASCDGCQLTMLDLEDELLALAEEIEIAHFLEARSQTVPGPWDLSLVEGSITTPEDAERAADDQLTLAVDVLALVAAEIRPVNAIAEQVANRFGELARDLRWIS